MAENRAKSHPGHPSRWQVLDALPSRLELVAGLGVRYFGLANGFVVNFSFEIVIRFDLDGMALEVLPGAYRTGVTEVGVGGRKLRPTTMAPIN